MKRVDENYSYDELEGFEGLNFTRRAVCTDEIWMTVSSTGMIWMTKKAKDILFTRKYIRLAYKPEKKLLLLCSEPNDGPDSIKLQKSSRNMIQHKQLSQFIGQECRYDLSIVNVRIPGTVCHSKRNAIIFDLNRATSVKPRKREK